MKYPPQLSVYSSNLIDRFSSHVALKLKLMNDHFIPAMVDKVHFASFTASYKGSTILLLAAFTYQGFIYIQCTSRTEDLLANSRYLPAL